MRRALSYLVAAALLVVQFPSAGMAEYRCVGEESRDGTVYTVEGSGGAARSCPVKCTRAYDSSDNTDRIRYIDSCAGNDAGSTRWINASAVYYTSSEADKVVQKKNEDDHTGAFVIGGLALLGLVMCGTGTIICKGRR